MKVTNGELINRILPAVEKVGREGPPKVPVLAVLKVRKILRSLREHVRDVVETRNEFLDKFGLKDKDGKLVMIGVEVQFAEGNRAKFIEAQRTLYSGEFDYVGPTITLKDLGKMEITGGLLADLGDLFCEDEKEPEGE